MSFQSVLVGNNTGRELLPTHEVAALDDTMDALLYAVRPYVMQRAGLKLLEVLIQLHDVHRCVAIRAARGSKACCTVE